MEYRNTAGASAPEAEGCRLALPRAAQSLSQTIINSIVQRLMANDLRPGDKLPTEPELCRQFGVSRNTVREAIKMLSMLGLITIKRGEGTFISQSLSTMSINPLLLGLALEPRTSQEVIELRQLLDIGAAELLIDKATPEDIDGLERLNNDILRATENGLSGTDSLFAMDLNFHRRFHELTNNRLLVYLYQTIYEMFGPSIKESVSHDPGSIYRNHRQIIEALRSRDKNKAREAVMTTLTNWRNAVG